MKLIEIEYRIDAGITGGVKQKFAMDPKKYVSHIVGYKQFEPEVPQSIIIIMAHREQPLIFDAKVNELDLFISEFESQLKNFDDEN